MCQYQSLLSLFYGPVQQNSFLQLSHYSQFIYFKVNCAFFVSELLRTLTLIEILKYKEGIIPAVRATIQWCCSHTHI